jgi:hypothetical protein
MSRDIGETIRGLRDQQKALLEGATGADMLADSYAQSSVEQADKARRLRLWAEQINEAIEALENATPGMHRSILQPTGPHL